MLKNGFRGPVLRHVDPPHSLINQWNQEMATPPTTHTSSLLSCTFSPYPPLPRTLISPDPLFYSHPHFPSPPPPLILSSIHTLTSLPLPPYPLFDSHPHFPSPPPLSSLLFPFFTPSLPFPFDTGHGQEAGSTRGAKNHSHKLPQK